MEFNFPEAISAFAFMSVDYVIYITVIRPHLEIKKRMIGLKPYWAGWNEKESGKKEREIMNKIREKEWNKDEYARRKKEIRLEKEINRLNKLLN